MKKKKAKKTPGTDRTHPPRRPKYRVGDVVWFVRLNAREVLLEKEKSPYSIDCGRVCGLTVYDGGYADAVYEIRDSEAGPPDVIASEREVYESFFDAAAIADVMFRGGSKYKPTWQELQEQDQEKSEGEEQK